MCLCTSRRSSEHGLKSLNEGQRISFDVEPDKKGKGPKAVNLVIRSVPGHVGDASALQAARRERQKCNAPDRGPGPHGDLFAWAV